MMNPALRIRPFDLSDENTVVELWHACGLTRPWNDPRRDIARKLSVQPELFLLGTTPLDEVVATAMVGFDGHRGWVYYLAVAADHRRRGFGRALMHEAARLLVERGCPKLNLLVRAPNTDVIDFYRKLGYGQDDVVELGKRLIHDSEGPSPRPSPQRGEGELEGRA